MSLFVGCQFQNHFSNHFSLKIDKYHCRIEDMSNKKAFQSDAFHPLADREGVAV